MTERHAPAAAAGRSREDELEVELAGLEEVKRHLRLSAQSTSEVEDHLLMCRTKLAVERSGVPDDQAVVVLSADPGRPWELNGRPVHLLPPDSTATRWDIERLRRAMWVPEPVAPRRRVRTSPHQTRAVYVVAPRNRPTASGAAPALHGWLGRWRTTWSDHCCTIYAIPVCAQGPPREVVAAWPRPLPPGLKGDLAFPHCSYGGLELSGWGFAEGAKTVAVRVDGGGSQGWDVSTGVHRPDVAATFPGEPSASRAGFRMWIDLAEHPRNVHLRVRVVLEDGRTALLAEVLVRTV